MALLTYVVEYGDYLTKIASEHGTTWQAIWNHPANAELRAKRGSPDVLYPGDVLQIPDQPEVPGSEPPSSVPPVQPKPVSPPPVVPWPYTFIPAKTRAPSWRCPAGLCECREGAEDHCRELYILLLDHFARPIPRARCVVEIDGYLADAPPNANEHGWLTIVVQADYEMISVAWAPRCHFPMAEAKHRIRAWQQGAALFGRRSPSREEQPQAVVPSARYAARRQDRVRVGNATLPRDRHARHGGQGARPQHLR